MMNMTPSRVIATLSRSRGLRGSFRKTRPKRTVQMGEAAEIIFASAAHPGFSCLSSFLFVLFHQLPIGMFLSP